MKEAFDEICDHWTMSVIKKVVDILSMYKISGLKIDTAYPKACLRNDDKDKGIFIYYVDGYFRFRSVLDCCFCKFCCNTIDNDRIDDEFVKALDRLEKNSK